MFDFLIKDFPKLNAN